jgi:hypothetical protein
MGKRLSSIRSRRFGSWPAAIFACLVALTTWDLHAASPDLSTPKRAGFAFVVAIEAGDMATAKTLATGNEEQWKIVQTMSDFCVVIADMEKSMVKKFGASAQLPEGMRQRPSAFAAAAEEEIIGDTAVLINKENPHDPHPMTLNKTGDIWKVDLSNLTQDPDGLKTQKELEARTKRMRAVISKLDHGDYAGSEQVMAAINSAAGP